MHKKWKEWNFTQRLVRRNWIFAANHRVNSGKFFKIKRNECFWTINGHVVDKTNKAKHTINAKFKMAFPFFHHLNLRFFYGFFFSNELDSLKSYNFWIIKIFSRKNKRVTKAEEQRGNFHGIKYKWPAPNMLRDIANGNNKLHVILIISNTWYRESHTPINLENCHLNQTNGHFEKWHDCCFLLCFFFCWMKLKTKQKSDTEKDSGVKPASSHSIITSTYTLIPHRYSVCLQVEAIPSSIISHFDA